MLERISYLMEIMTIVLCIHALYGKKFRLDIETVVLVSMDVLLLQAISEQVIEQRFTILLYPMVFIYCCIKFGYNKKELVVNNVLYIVIVTISQICSWLITALWNVQGLSNEMLMMINNLIVFLFFLFAIPYCKLNLLSNYMQQKGILVKTALLSCFIFIIYLILKLKISAMLIPENYLMIIISIGLICLLVYKWQQNQFKVKEQAMEIQMHHLYDETFQNLIDEIRGRQHDFENHIHAVYSQHYTCSTYEELVEKQKKYCEVMSETNKYNKLLNAGNSTIIGFLYGKFIQAEKKNVDIKYKVGVDKLESRLPVYKFVEIIGNLFDNAIEAVESMEVEKIIYLDFIENEEQILFTIRNQSKYITQEEISQIFERGKSSKGEKRGLGLANVKQICNDYKCELIVENKELEGKNYMQFRICVKK